MAGLGFGYKCCICGGYFHGYGNNPDGAMWLDAETKQPVHGEFKTDDRCCDACNSKFVLPGRMYDIYGGKD